MRLRAGLLWIIAFGCLAWAPGSPLVRSGLAAPGNLDSFYNHDGYRRFGAGNRITQGGGVVAQPDGRVVVVGSCQNGPDWDFAVFRYNVDGSPDASFGEEGRVVTSVSAGADFAHCVTLQGDGKILVGGTAAGQFAVVRYHADGGLDASFGGDGRATLGVGYHEGNAIALQPDGKILLAGSRVTDNFHFAVSRFNADGSPDLAFGVDGVVTTPVSRFDEAHGVAIQPDGQIVACGSASDYNTFDAMVVVRYHPDGSLDTAFDFDGIKTLVLGSYTRGNAVAIQTSLTAATKIVVAGSAGQPGTYDDFALVRLNLDGSLDFTFDNDGVVLTDFAGSVDWVVAVSIQYSGATPNRIIVAGQAITYDGFDFAVARYAINGALDPTFDGDGRNTAAVGPSGPGLSDDYATGMAMSFGASTVVGSTKQGFGDCGIVRFGITGLVDAAFGVDGKIIQGAGSIESGGTAGVVQPDGRIVTAGFVADSTLQPSPSAHSVAVFRSLPDGSIDTTFGDDGHVLIPASFGDEAINAVVVAPGAKILLAGNIGPGISHSLLVRLDADGSPDPTFDGDGILLQAPGSPLMSVEDAVVQPDGKIVVAGAYDFGPGVTMVAVRYQVDGALDLAFGTGGVATINFGFVSAAHGVVLQTDGRIVLAGHVSVGFTDNFAVARLNADGTLDPSFAGTGSVITSVSGQTSRGMDVVLDAVGRIVVAGRCGDLGSLDAAVVRYDTAGSLDPTFNGDGRAIVSLGALSGGAESVVVQPNGRMVIAGSRGPGPGAEMVLARLEANGSLDMSYGNLGTAVLDLTPGASDAARDLGLDADGHAIVTGTSGGLMVAARVLGDDPVAGVPDQGPLRPGSLLQAGAPHPNPTQGGASVRFRTEFPGPISAQILDMQGRLVRTLDTNAHSAAGEHELAWDGLDDRGARAPTSVYFMRLRQGKAVEARRIIVMR